MHLYSTAFGNAEMIPTQHTGEGLDTSPPLYWTDLPTDSVSLALVCEDPDAPFTRFQDQPYVHWVLFNVPAGVGMVPEGLPHGWRLERPIPCEQGLNSHGRPGYNGPYPPSGHGTHRYVFRLYALPRMLELPVRPMKSNLLQAMEGLVLGATELIGTYVRESQLRRVG